MKRLHILGLTCVCLGIAAMLLFRVSTHAIAARPSSCGSWNVVPSPNGTNNMNNDNTLSGVATISATDIWAVGDYTLNIYHYSFQTLIEHWNGTNWSIVPSPNVPTLNNILNGVTAISATDIWAVGDTFSETQEGASTLVEHWDGTTWSIIPSPSPIEYSGFSGVAAISATDIWAVGSGREPNYGNEGVGLLIEHWNGSQWSVVPSPTSIGTLNSVTAISTNNVWAVGMTGSGPSASLIEHWDGTQWSIVQHPDPPERRVELRGVAAVSATNIWAVGSYGSNNFAAATLFEHWNGKKWNIVPGVPKPRGVVLTSVAVLSPTNIWAVGGIGVGTITEHWNGSTWSVVASPSPGYSTGFDAVASVPGSNYVWAVGGARYITANDNNVGNTLTAYYC